MKNKYTKLFFNKWFIILLIFAIVLRGIWFFTPLELDEGTYAYVASMWVKGYQPYTYFDNKFPILYLNYFPPILLKDASFLIFRLYGATVFIFNLILLVLLIYELEKKVKLALFGGAIYTLLMQVPLLQGFLNKPGLFFDFYFILSLLFLCKYLKFNKNISFYLSSLFFILAILSNSLNLFYIAFLNLALILHEKGIKKLLEYLIIPISVISAIIGLFYFVYNVNFVSKAMTLSMNNLSYFTYRATFHNYGFPILFLEAMIPIMFILSLAIINVAKQNKFYKINIFFVISVLALFFILPTYGHYLVSLFPVVAIIGAKTIFPAYPAKKKSFHIIFLALLLIFILLVSIKYYPNLNVKKSVNFDDFESYNSQKTITEFLANDLNKTENFYYWGWNPGLYWQAGKKFPYPYVDLRCGANTIIDNETSSSENMHDVILTYNKRINKDFTYKFLIIPEAYETNCLEFNETYSKINPVLLKTIGNMRIYTVTGNI